MSIEQLEYVSDICLSAGLFLLIVAGIMYVKMDIDKAWHFLTGRNAVKKETKRNMPQHQRRAAKEKEEYTEKLQQDELSESQETTVLETTKDIFEIVYEVTYIHTDLY